MEANDETNGPRRSCCCGKSCQRCLFFRQRSQNAILNFSLSFFYFTKDPWSKHLASPWVLSAGWKTLNLMTEASIHLGTSRVWMIGSFPQATVTILSLRHQMTSSWCNQSSKSWPNHKIYSSWIRNGFFGQCQRTWDRCLGRKAAPRASFMGTLREWNLEKGVDGLWGLSTFMARKGTLARTWLGNEKLNLFLGRLSQSGSFVAKI